MSILKRILSWAEFTAENPILVKRAHVLFSEMHEAILKRTDRMFAVLMLCQWAFGIFCAFIIAPRAWDGEHSYLHPHVWAAILLGAVITLFPVMLAWLKPGWVFTRHTIAVSQMLWSALLIHLTGGRIETHFHVFGSLAFVAFYRDWKVLVTATVVVATDHFLRGVFWPQSVFGVLVAGQWQWLEHAAWVLFIDFFLMRACFQAQQEMWAISVQQAGLEKINEEIEEKVRIRTHQLEMEKALTQEQAKKLAESNEELQQFAYIASHDLQEPLRMISSYLQLLAKRYKGKLDQDADEYIGFAVDGAQRLKRLIEDLLEYSRITTHKRPKIEINSEEIFSRALKNLQVAIAESGTVVTFDQLPVIKADEIQLERLFQNLVGNAIKYRKKETLQCVHVSALQDNGQWVFSVHDNGIGIAKDDFDRIFKIFQRLHTASEYSGTGIGLSVCKKIVENHGGKIWLDSKPGFGSTFFFSIMNGNSEKRVVHDRSS